MIRALILLTALATTAAAQPPALPIPVEAVSQPGVNVTTYTDAVHVIGWSPDGRYLAMLYRSSGQGAVGDRLALHVQDLATDARVAELMLTSNEPEEDPNVEQIWRSRRQAIRRALAVYHIRESGASLRMLPLRGRGGPYEADLTTTAAPDGGISGYTLSMRNGRGRTKTIETRTFEYPTTSASPVGVLVAPTGDRAAVILAIGAPGFENNGGVRYRIVGAGIGARF